MMLQTAYESSMVKLRNQIRHFYYIEVISLKHGTHVQTFDKRRHEIMNLKRLK